MSVFLYNLDLSNLRRSNHINEPKFPQTLHQMLEEAEREGLAHIISWHTDGRSFRVHDQSRFAEIVLPKHFSQSKYRSFQRQLNHYGFERITKGPMAGFYRHSNFLRDDKDLCKSMGRVKQKKTATPPKRWELAAPKYVSRSNSITSSSETSSASKSSTASNFTACSEPYLTLSQASLVSMLATNKTRRDSSTAIKRTLVKKPVSFPHKTDIFEELCDLVFEETNSEEEFALQCLEANDLFLTENPPIAYDLDD